MQFSLLSIFIVTEGTFKGDLKPLWEVLFPSLEVSKERLEVALRALGWVTRRGSTLDLWEAKAKNKNNQTFQL